MRARYLLRLYGQSGVKIYRNREDWRRSMFGEDLPMTLLSFGCPVGKSTEFREVVWTGDINVVSISIQMVFKSVGQGDV